MREFWRPLSPAAMLIAMLIAGAASAQTVTVTKAPPGGLVQLVLNSTQVAAGKADADGIASLDVGLKAQRNKTETDVRIYIDFCGDTRRVTLVETGYQPEAAAPGCVRREIFGAFYLREVTTLVVRASDEAPGVWIAQGHAPRRWLGNEAAGGSAEETGSALYIPNGFHVFAGGGLAHYGDFAPLTCGSASNCTASGNRLAGQVGMDYWLTRRLAFEAFYLRSTKPASAGGGSLYAFDSSLAANIAAVTAKFGLPVGKMRIYFQGGGTYTWAKLKTRETVPDRPISVDGADQVIPGATQSMLLETRGLGWTVSGGTEYWWKSSMALYLEAGTARLRGSPIGNGEGELRQSLVYAVTGFRFRLAGAR